MYSALFLFLLQQKLSIFVIIGVVLVLMLAVGLVVYFSRRVKVTEKEAEENWNHSMHSIFVDAVPRAKASPPAEPEIEAAPERTERETSELSAETFIEEAEPPREFAQKFEQEPEIIEPPAPQRAQVRETLPLHQVAEPEIAQSTPVESEPAPQAREPISYDETRPLVQPPVKDEPTGFDEGDWKNLEARERREAKQTRMLASEPEKIVPPFAEQTAEPSEPRRDEQEREARVAGSSGRERFVPPRIEPMGRRERFEPPRIDPLTPREQSDFVERRSQTRALASESFDARPARVDRPAPRSAQAIDMAAQPARQASIAHKKTAGSVLGIASEAPGDGPLVLGEPVRPAEDAGIHGLSRYGKASDEKAGRAGTIALLLIVLLVAGAIGAYYAIPSFRGWVDKQMAIYSGRQAEEERRAALEPKAKVLPNKNEQIKGTNRDVASGSVENISGNALENLSVELSLQREANAPAETITVDVTPAGLASGEVGTYRFEFERDAKFPASYRITRLLSNGNEIKFRYPGQNQQ